MPCYTVTTIKTNVGKWDITRWETVQKSTPELRNMRYSNDQLISRETTHNALVQLAKRLYAKQTILDASKRFGFRVTSQTSTNQVIQLKLSR